MKTFKNLGKSIDVVLSLNSIPLGGQQNASLIRQTAAIDITNKINGEWTENLAGTKSWSVQCNGLYVIDDKGFEKLEEAFMNNTKISVLISIGQKKYEGEALLIDFPLAAVFDKEFKYNLRLMGTGALKER